MSEAVDYAFGEVIPISDGGRFRSFNSDQRYGQLLLSFTGRLGKRMGVIAVYDYDSKGKDHLRASITDSAIGSLDLFRDEDGLAQILSDLKPVDVDLRFESV